MATEIPTTPLLRDLISRQTGAWEALYDKYAPCLYGLILQEVPGDIADALLERVFTDIYNNIREYEPNKERFFTWMYRLTLYRCALAKEAAANHSSIPSRSAFSKMANG